MTQSIQITKEMTDIEIMNQFREENMWGLCTAIDLKNCNPDTIRDPQKIHQFVVEVCDLIEMKRFGEPLIVNFGANDRVAGYSLVQLIETSCISGHFANDTSSAYIDIFSCKEYPPQITAEFCKKFFGAEEIRTTVFFRSI
ncbi:S-adenosylmethionine/arginine decarboxylase-like enzyme [Methanocalculus alkaliphilus]|uniref:S-adenosylmethionine decarboxylase n=1 Tax=Methanocalculus alkaliphilus TaxID=768730 RepID=UPI00344D5AE7|nr:S-adenosylmethionine/arginine decarboxylase-like enzyme [Methanocalculus alkaliphilus]